MDNELRKLKKVKIRLMRTPQFVMWQGIMMLGETSISDEVPTACTNGRDEIYGREFIKELSEKELGFIILHETLHKAFRHLTVYKRLHEENAQLANAACDYVINLMLVDADPQEKYIAMPQENGKPMGLLDRKYAGMNSKQVFYLLQQEQEDRPTSPTGQSDGSGDEDDESNSDGGSAGLDDHDWEGANNVSPSEEKKLEREVDRALRQGQIAASKLAGEDGGDMNRAIGELLEPYVDWRELLREFITSMCSNKDTSSWRKVNRRYLANNIYLPSLVGESLGSIVVGIDTSGSITEDEINRFISEVVGITTDVTPDKVHLLYWDCEVQAHEEYTPAEFGDLVHTQPKGGGGTSPVCVQEYLAARDITPECIVMLTDGYVWSWGDAWDAPIIWAITKNGIDGDAPCGKTIKMQD